MRFYNLLSCCIHHLLRHQLMRSSFQGHVKDTTAGVPLPQSSMPYAAIMVSSMPTFSTQMGIISCRSSFDTLSYEVELTHAPWK